MSRAKRTRRLFLVISETLEQRQLLSASFDNSFGGDGKVEQPEGFFMEAAIAPGGQVVALYESGNVSRVTRYHANGDIDMSFGGGDGNVELPIFGRTLAVQNDGKIVVGGAAGNLMNATAAITRLNANGTPDTAFGDSGTLVIERGFTIEAWGGINDVEILGNGSIVAAGTLVPRNNSSQLQQYTAFRITPTGQLDPTFSRDGITHVTTVPWEAGGAHKLSVRPDGKLVLIGTQGPNDDVLIARVNADGYLDGSFGTQGTLRLPGMQGPLDIETQFGNKAVVGLGETVIRLNASGATDSTFKTISWAPGANGPVRFEDIEIGTFIDILIAGSRSTDVTDGSYNATYFEHASDGTPQQTLALFGNSNATSLDIAGGKALVGGHPRMIMPDQLPRVLLARLNLDGDTTPPPTGTGLTGTYFDNDNFTNPKFARVDSTVNFDWGGGSPSPSIAPDTFSVRWTGKITVPTSGTWTFYVPSDDRAKLTIGGITVVDYVPGKTPSSGTINLKTLAQYDIVLEYREFGGSARASLQWSGPGVTRRVVPTTALTPATFTPTDTQAPTTPTNFRAAHVGHDNIRLAWNPSTDNVGVSYYEISRNDQFFVRSSFAGFTDVNLQPNTTYNYSVVAVDDAGNRSAPATLSVRTTAAPAGTGLQVTYFDNIDFTNPVEHSISPTVDYDWGSSKASPFHNDADFFSARWRGHIKVDRSGSYRIGVNSDNGARLWVDGRLLIDNLSPTATVSESALIFLSAGRMNDVILEVVEGTGDARAQLLWSTPDTPVMSPIPSSALFASMSGAPLVPTNVQAAKVTGGVRVSWNEVAGETGYTIQRRLGTSGTWTTVGTAPADALVFTDTSTLSSGTYYYRVRADNRTFGSSQYELSNPVTI